MFRWKALILFLVLSFAVASSVSAQMDATNKGNILVGGAVSMSSVDTEGVGDRINTWALAPRGMYFVAENFAIGTEFGFVGITSGDLGTSSHRHFGLAQYVFPGNEKVRPYAETGGGFVRLTAEDPLGNTVFNGWGMKAGFGAYMFVNEHVSITPQIAYIYESFSDDGTITRGTDQTIFVGIGVSGFVLP